MCAQESTHLAESVRLEDYLAMIGSERERRPSEAMLADEIHRLRRLLSAPMGGRESDGWPCTECGLIWPTHQPGCTQSDG